MLALAVATWFASQEECSFGQENVLSCDDVFYFQRFYLTGFWLIVAWPGFFVVGLGLRWYWQIVVVYDKVGDAVTFG